MRKRLGKIFILILPLLASVGLTAGEIKGIVRDETNAPLEGVPVAASSTALPGGATTSTGADGRFSMSNVPAGDYAVEAKFGTATAKGTVKVAADGTAPEVALKISMGEAMAEAVTYEITGTRLRSTNAVSVSPVTSISSTEVATQGNTSVENVVSTLPQAFLAQASTISNGSDGTAQVSLRGLGPQRNLLLINGRRINNDLNFIPTKMVAGIDVLTGGSSAVYGADAIAGVVNFKTLKDYEGAKFEIDWNMYQHNQQNTMVQEIIRNNDSTAYRQGRAAVPGNVWNLNIPALSAVIGVNSPDKKGNVTAYAQYRKDNPIFQSDRDFTSIALLPDAFFGGSAGVYLPAGSSTSEPAVVGITGRPTQVVRGTGAGRTFVPYNSVRDNYNFAPLNYLQRPDERYQLGAFSHYDIEPWAKVYTEAMYMNDRSVFQIAPGGYFRGRPTPVRCDNPLLSAAQRAIACPTFNALVNPDQTFTANIGRRNIEGGPRRGDRNHNSFRYLLGLKGDLGADWNYDLATTYMQTEAFFGTEADFHAERLKKSIDVVTDDRAIVAGQPNPFFGQIVCRSFYDGTDRRCLPYQIFDETPIAQNVLSYLTTPTYSGDVESERNVDFNLAGNLGSWGVTSPFAKDGVAVSLGGQWRHNYIQNWNDDVALLGLGSGSGGRAVNIERSSDVYEAFGETRLPFIQDRRFAKNVALEAAYRYSNYSFGKQTHTYKAGGEWEFYDDSKIRASYQRAVRAPTLGDLYSPPRPFLVSGADPCAGLADTPANAAQILRCQNAFALSKAQVLAIERNPASQYWARSGGNANLEPEIGDTFTFGIFTQPSFIPGLTLSVDYYNITVAKAIGNIGASLTLSRCLASQDPNSEFCRNVVRDPIGNTIWFEDGYVNLERKNLANFATSGVDFFLAYRLKLDDIGLKDMGTVEVSTNANLQLTYKTSPEGTFTYDCVGYFGDTACGSANPRWRQKARLTWDLPFGLSASAQWRFFGGADIEYSSPDPVLNQDDPVGNTAFYLPETTLGARNYLDLFASYKVGKNFSFSIGVNNVLDTDPPLFTAGGSNGNVDALSYDVLGRYIFTNAKAEF